MLSLRFNPHHMLYNAHAGFMESYKDGFDPRSFEMKEELERPARTISMLPPLAHLEAHSIWTEAMETGEKIWLLDPENYRVCGNGYSWGPVVTLVIISLILRIVMFCITTAFNIDLQDGNPPQRVGEDVPPCHIYSICLGLDKAEGRLYRSRMQHLFRQLYIGDTDMVNAMAALKDIDLTVQERNTTSAKA